MPDLTAMRPAAPLAPALGSFKPDHRRKLRPVDRIKPFVPRADRHRAFQRRDDSRPSGRLDLFAILVNETATCSTTPASTLYGLPKPPPAQWKTPGLHGRG